MNCVNHPEAAATAWCQNCGKPLCAQCTHMVGGSVYCEPCLVARTAGASGFAPGAPGATGAQGPYATGIPPAGAPNPGTAAILGFIPGVGAMYNGQYIKALVHVLVFVVLVGISEHVGLFGMVLAAWVIYQVFDAHQTAKARRDGLPLPDPFGLNELGNAIGGHAGARPYAPPPPPSPPPPGGGPAGAAPGAAPSATPGAAPGAGGTVPPGNPAYADWAEQVRQQAHAFGQQTAEWGEQLRQRIVAEAQARPFTPWNQPPGGTPGAAPGFVPGAGTGYTQPPPGWAPPIPPVPLVPPEMELERARREPIGAIILILLGMLFLFNTLGFFSFHWVSRGWPLIIVAIAVWLIARNSGRYGWGPRVGPPPPPPPVPPVEPYAASSTPSSTASSTTGQEPPAGGGQ